MTAPAAVLLLAVLYQLIKLLVQAIIKPQRNSRPVEPPTLPPEPIQMWMAHSPALHQPSPARRIAEPLTHKQAAPDAAEQAAKQAAEQAAKRKAARQPEPDAQAEYQFAFTSLPDDFAALQRDPQVQVQLNAEEETGKTHAVVTLQPQQVPTYREHLRRWRPLGLPLHGRQSLHYVDYPDTHEHPFDPYATGLYIASTSTESTYLCSNFAALERDGIWNLRMGYTVLGISGRVFLLDEDGLIVRWTSSRISNALPREHGVGLYHLARSSNWPPLERDSLPSFHSEAEALAFAQDWIARVSAEYQVNGLQLLCTRVLLVLNWH